MVLAHSVGGAELELLLVAGAILVLGIIFFVQKVAKPQVAIGMIVLAFIMGAGSFALGGDTEPQSSSAVITILSPKEGDSVPAGEPFTVELELRNGSIDGPEAGHLHIYVDDDEDNAAMVADLSSEITIEEPGSHLIEVEYVSSDHSPFEPPVIASVEVTAE